MKPHFLDCSSYNNVIWVSQSEKTRAINEYNYFCNWVHSQRLLLLLLGKKLGADTH